MKNEANKSRVEKLLILLLFSILASCILMVLLTGANAYRRLTERGREAYRVRTVPQFIATKVRQADERETISLGKLGEVETLEFTEVIEDKSYITRIYCYDGYVRELFSAIDSVCDPMEGETIIEAEEVKFDLQDGCLQVLVKHTDGTLTEQKLTLRSAEGEENHEK